MSQTYVDAETIVFLTQLWGGSHIRSGPTRAVSQLCLVTSDYGLHGRSEMKEHFTFIDLRENQES